MKLELTVKAIGHHVESFACVNVPEPFIAAFEPLRFCTNPALAYALSETTANSEEAQKILTFRQEAASEIATALSQLIVDEMTKNDTLDGYLIKNEA